MNLKQVRASFFDFINRHKIISIASNSAFDLFFFTIRKINKLFAHTGGNVAVISLHRLGDTVFTIPAIREIKKNFNKKITIVCLSESIPIYNLAFDDINFLELDIKEFYFSNRIANFKARKKLRSLKPEIIIDLKGGSSSASLLFTSRAREIIGISIRQFRYIYYKMVAIRESPQLIDIYLDGISPIIKIQDREGLKKVAKLINSKGKILLHPFAGYKEKEWNFKKFIGIAEKLKEDYQASLLVPSGYLCTDVLREIEYKNIEVIQTNSVEELIQSIKECSLFIGNDTGPVNIANFLGKPTFTIYGATNPEYTAPAADHQVYIQNVLKCSARLNEKYCITGGGVSCCSGVQCMDFLTVQEVYDKLIPLIRKYCDKIL